MPQVCKCIPRVLKGYQMEEIVTRESVQRMIAERIRANAGIRNKDVVDTLILKGRIELEEAMEGYTQRHHLITAYIRKPELAQREAERRAFLGKDNSRFLTDFYTSKA